jgi:Zn-dependent protease
MRASERNDLIVSWLTISVAFALLLGKSFLNIAPFWFALPTALVGVGTGFVLHELGHRQIARKFGAHSEFRAWNFGLLLALGTAVLSFFSPLKLIFAAPGAVYTYGPYLSRDQHGLISLAGPLTNILVALLFFLLNALQSIFIASELVAVMLVYGALINLWLAFFNLIPIPPLDGSKVFSWNPLLWALLFFPLLWFV